MSGGCPVCGFDGSSLSPADAAVALRTLPRRYRAVLVRPQEEGEHKDPVHRPAADGWSAIAHAGWAADAITAVAGRLHQVLVTDHPDLGAGPPPVDPAQPPRAPEDTGAVLARLTAATDELTTEADRTKGEAWLRTGAAAGTAVTALDLLRAAVHQGVHHLKAADRVLQEVVGRP